MLRENLARLTYTAMSDRLKDKFLKGHAVLTYIAKISIVKTRQIRQSEKECLLYELHE
jgi:hypothetical protein